MGVKLLIFILIMFFTFPAFSCSYGSNMSGIRSVNDTHAFIGWGNYENFRRNNEDIVKKDYPKTGFYELKTKKLLWEMNDFTTKMFVTPLRNNRNVYVEFINAYKMNDKVLAFYKDGNLLKSYKVNDFCIFQPNKHICPGTLDWDDDLEINEDLNTMSFKSCGSYYEIDLLTGERRKPFLKNYVLFFSFGLIKWK